MASATAAAARTARSFSLSWSALAGIPRAIGASSSSRHSLLSSATSRGYSGGAQLQDPESSTPGGADGPAAPSGFPPAAAKPVANDNSDLGGSSRGDTGRNPYPPRHFRTPRGVYKAILLGEVGQLPIQKILKSGKAVTIFTVGTGGMYNNRRPFDGESPEEFAERSYTQWHRVSVYQDRVASMVMQHVKIGSQVYLEGNIETRVYNDPSTGLVKRMREIAIRANGRLMFMDAAFGAKPAATVARPSVEDGPINSHPPPEAQSET